MGKTVKQRRKKDPIAGIVAGIHRVTPRYVRMVRDGERENEDIMATLVDLNVGMDELIRRLKAEQNLERLAKSIHSKNKKKHAYQKD